MSDDEFEQWQVSNINRQAEQRFRMNLLGCVLIALLLLCAVGIYLTRGQ